ncbi:MAG: hypothetical protein ACTHLB_04065 [Parafilimonas sp.]|jgi:YD repeat-containing protein
MKHLSLIATIAVAMLSFASCKKDSSDPAPGGPGNSGKKLVKVIETEDGQVTTYNLTYNNDNRLTSVKSTDDSKSTIFTYDNAGNLTGIEQREDNDFKNVYTYTYQNNIPVSGTFKSWQLTAGEPDALIEDDKLTYIVSNNQVTNIKVDLLMGETSMNFAIAYANGNPKSISSTGAYKYSATFTFGNHKPIFPKVTNWVLDQAGFAVQYGVENELLSVTWDFPGTEEDYSINSTYTFDDKGYALTSTDGTTQLKFEYQ